MHGFCAWWASTGQQSLIGVLVQILRLRMMASLIDNDDIDDDDNDGHFADKTTFFFSCRWAVQRQRTYTALLAALMVQSYSLLGKNLQFLEIISQTNQKCPGKLNIMQTYILDTY